MVNLGGKAQNLVFLKKRGFNVPDLFVVSFEDIFKKNVDSIKKEILERTINWKEKLILRSSADCEDCSKNSFAGLFESIVIESPREINSAIKKIIKSADNLRVREYLKLKKIKKKPKISIIVQKFIEGEISGVIFNLKENYLINSNFGTAVSIVQGKACDEYSINKKTNQTRIINKLKNSLNKRQIARVVYEVTKINQILNSPQDIEWTIKENKLYILQSRPITKFDEKEEILVWDNSNIAESYSGVVLPLTYSFAKRMYSKVYRQVALASGVSKKRLSSYGDIFDDMLGHFYGRFYYNMENWYKMLTLFPGYETNKINFDRMISIQSKTELEKDYRNNVSFLFRLKYYPLILLKYLNFNRGLIKFERKIKKLLEDFRRKNLDKLSRKELLKEFYSLEKCFISVWHIPIENDFLAMTFHGLLIKEARKRGIEEVEILNQLSNIGKLRTAEQTRDLAILAKSPTSSAIDTYFNKYGGRFANELKLESEELTKNSGEFQELLKSYEFIEQKHKKDIKNVSLGLKGNFFLDQTKKYLRQREELRILRAKVFSLARKIFLETGKKMKDEGSIQDIRDIFYLNLNEIKEDLPKEELKGIILNRKQEYLKYIKINVPNIIYTNLARKIMPIKTKKDALLGDLIVGRPCSNGEVYGTATVVENSTPSFKKNLGIIITETADPGWAPILSLCKGIIIEKGGVLSHISILARELGVPCIINVPGIMQKIKKGDKVYMNGSNGEIKIGRNN